MQLIIDTETATLSTACDEPLVRAVFISLFSWGRAHSGDDVQDGDKYGWWGDTYADESGDKTGSRLWELLRKKATSESLRQAEEYAEEALQWLIDDAVAKSVTAEAEQQESGRIDMLVTIQKPESGKLSIRFQNVWEDL